MWLLKEEHKAEFLFMPMYFQMCTPETLMSVMPCFHQFLVIHMPSSVTLVHTMYISHNSFT